ncbi:MAG: RidA family protein [Planctomycetes bacterium]|nr:RidA family protein [Planctomycetota bacterium]
MSKLHSVQTEHAPAAIGPYSQAVVHANVAYCSGQIALDPGSGKLIEGDVRAQTDRVLKNLAAVLAAAGSGLDRVLKTTIFLADMADFAVVNEVYAQHFGASRPARATVAVRTLPRNALVEIDCIAAVGS